MPKPISKGINVGASAAVVSEPAVKTKPRGPQKPPDEMGQLRSTPVDLTGAERTGPARVPHNPAVPKEAQNATLKAMLDQVEQVAATGKTPVIFVDLDLTALLPTTRIVEQLKAVGETFDIPELKDPLELKDKNGNPMIPGYTEEAWMGFVEKTGLAEKYPHVNWNAPDRNNPGARAGGPLYSMFRSGYWAQDLKTDQVSPGLARFVELVAQRGGKVAFVSGRPGTPDASLYALEAGGIRNPTLHFGQKRSGLPLPRPNVRDGDADTKFQLTKEAEARNEVVVAIVDDRASNRSGVVAASSNPNIMSVAIAAPGFSYTPDAEDPNNPHRISSFAFLDP